MRQLIYHEVQGKVVKVAIKSRARPHAFQAVRSRHVPKSQQEAEDARQRLAFEELLLLQLRLLLQRSSIQCAPHSHPCSGSLCGTAS